MLQCQSSCPTLTHILYSKQNKTNGLGACCVPGNLHYFVHTANPCGGSCLAHYLEEKTEAQAQQHHFSVVTSQKKMKEGYTYQIRYSLVPLYLQFHVNKTKKLQEKERGILKFQMCYLIFIKPSFDYSDINLLQALVTILKKDPLEKSDILSSLTPQ